MPSVVSEYPPKHDPYAAMREQNYRLFVFGWLPASIGLQMQGTALAWDIYERTNDPLALGIVGLARALPTIALALPAGQIVDRVDRRRVLIATQLAFCVTSLLLCIGSAAWQRGLLGAGGSGVWLMYFLIALTGCARVFNGPSRSSLLPQLLKDGAGGAVFHNAVTWNSGVFQLAATLGPIAAGTMIYLTGSAWPVYAITVLTALWFAGTCVFIRPYVHEGDNIERHLGPLWQVVRPSVLLPGVLEGVAHVWREKTLFGVMTLDLLAVLVGGATALLPVYARDILHVDARGLGALRAAPYVGALLMAVVLAYRAPFQRAGRALLWSVAGFGICMVVFGLSKSFALSLAMLALSGALDNISVVVRHVLVSVRTPDRLRGRVSAVNSVFIESSNELGGFESGLVAKLWSPVISVVSGGIGTIVVVVGMALCIPELRRLGMLSGVAAKKTGVNGSE